MGWRWEMRAGFVGGGALLAALGLGACSFDAAGGAGTGTEDAGKGDAPDDADAGAEAGPGSGAEDGDADSDAGAGPCGGDLGSLPATEGDYIELGGALVASREPCEGALHATAGPEGATLRVQLDRWEGEAATARLRVEDLLGDPVSGAAGPADWTELGPGEGLTIELAQAGEVLLRLEPTALGRDDAPAHDYGLSVTCETGCDRAFTRYPTVFMHGMAGTDAYLDTLDYWFRLAPAVADAGYLARFPAVDAFSPPPTRAAQWRTHIEALVAEGVGRRFNLIAHSQGGLDARYLAARLDPDGRVASVVTVATPHQGTAVADLAAGIFDQFPVSTALIEGVLGVLGGLLGLDGSALAAQVAALSRPAMVDFNAEVVDVPGVYYASWAGRSCAAADLVCQLGNEGEVIDILLGPTHTFVDLAEGDNDGLVSVLSAQWGDYRGALPADHLDEVGQIADLINPSFDHRAFYLSELARLAERGL